MKLLRFSFLFLFLISPAKAFAYSRIVTLAPVVSEWVAQVLGDQTAKQNIVGVVEYSNYPAFLTSIASVGSYPKLDVEKIASLKPDLVLALAGTNRQEQIEQLQRLKLPVIILPTEKFSEMPDWIKNLGKALKEVGSADRLVARWTDEISHLKAKNKNTSLRMYLEIQHNPLVTIGGESFLNDAFSTLGYENIFKSLSQSYPKVSKEAVLKAKPQAIFILDLTGNSNDFSAPKKDWETYGFHPQIISGDLFARCGFQLLKGLRDL